MSEIALVAKRQQDLQNGDPDYTVYAGRQAVGRIYRLDRISDTWFWGINSVMLDATVGSVLQGYATGMEDARARLRSAFDRWLAWARAMPQDDRKYPRLRAELERIEG